MKTNKKLVCGVGLNDLTKIGNEATYSKWQHMLNRCYNPKHLIKYPTYKSCTVCDDWLTFSKFKEWFDLNNRAGMHLDKDILVRGNKIYGPQFCRLVPYQINSLLCDSGASRGPNIQGVTFNKTRQRYTAQIRKGNGVEYIGRYDTEQEAFNAYKIEKEKWIKYQADHYFSLGQIDKDIYTALQNWVIYP